MLFTKKTNPALSFSFPQLLSLYYIQDIKGPPQREQKFPDYLDLVHFCHSDKTAEVIEYWVHVRDELLKSQFKTQLLYLIPTADAQQFSQTNDSVDSIVVSKCTDQLFNEKPFLPLFF